MHPILTEGDLANFERDGFIIMRQLATPDEVAELSTVALVHLDQEIEPIQYEPDDNSGELPTPRRLLQLYDRDETLAKWAVDERVTDIVTQLLDTKTLYLSRAHHNCIVTKHPEYSPATGWHQDLRHWEFLSSDLVNAWLALGEESPANGCMLLIPGSHRETIEDDWLTEDLCLREDLPETQALIQRAEAIPLAPGDVVFYHAGLFHAYGDNSTDILKLSLVTTYYSADNGPMPATRSSRITPVLAVEG